MLEPSHSPEIDSASSIFPSSSWKAIVLLSSKLWKTTVAPSVPSQPISSVTEAFSVLLLA
ncbi:hypothetical protein [Listeria grayi]|uniref:hypothetical protein n=1 Tax=Listeria grayi TaxID=1641 RepID=UPI00117A3336|nr:hypothetical protein [Listeria grayi]